MQEQEKVRVFVVASNRLLREALARILNKRSDISTVGATQISPEAIQQISDSRAAVLLLNLAPADPADLEFIRQLRRALPPLRVVLVGMDDAEPIFLHAVRVGVVGYVLKEASAMDVTAAIRAVAQGEAVCPPRLCRFLFDYVAEEWTERPNIRVKIRLGLTRREQQLVPLIAQGLTNKEIAARLSLSEQTVKNHIHRILQKVGAEDRLTVVEMCRSQGLGI